MQTHPKKKLELIVEKPITQRLLDLLDGMDVTGYTVLPAIAGRGQDGAWEEGQITAASHMVQIVCVLDEAKLEEVLPAAFEALRPQIGIVYVSDVAVVREAHF